MLVYGYGYGCGEPAWGWGEISPPRRLFLSVHEKPRYSRPEGDLGAFGVQLLQLAVLPA